MNSFEQQTGQMFVSILEICSYMILQLDVFNTIDVLTSYFEPHQRIN